MVFEVVLAPGAIAALKSLRVPVRVGVVQALNIYLTHEPTKVSKSRIKRLRGLSQLQYRLRIGDIRVFYDVTEAQSKSSPSSRRPTRKRGSTNKGHQSSTAPREVALAKVKDDLSKYLRQAAEEEIVITRHGRPAGLLIGFATEEDWFDYRLEHHPEFLRRIQEARLAIREGRGVPLKDAV